MTDGEMLILANVAKHVTLLPEEQTYFLGLLQPKTIKRKEFLLQAGEVCRCDTYVTKGCLRYYYIDDNGVEHNVMFAPEDWWTSDMYSLLTQTPSHYFIEAIEDTEMLLISKANMEELFLNVPKFDRFFRIILQNAYVAKERRIMQNLGQNAEARYTDFITRYPQLAQRLPLKQIASYLGITPEFLSMLRRKAAEK